MAPSFRFVQVPVQWKLTAPPGMEAPDSSGPNIPPWIGISPQSGMLTPGQTVEISFRIGVPDPCTAAGVLEPCIPYMQHNPRVQGP